MIEKIVHSQAYEIQQSLERTGFIQREQKKHIQQHINTPLAKVIVGPRRSGKSTLCRELIRDKRFAYLNFDDERIQYKTLDTDELLSSLCKHSPEIFFFDEIQNMPKRELFINRLLRHNYNIILTGSNAHLLSKELGTHLTGRHISFTNYPFSFQEAVHSQGIQFNIDYVHDGIYQSKLLAIFDTYLTIGGLPELWTSTIDPLYYSQSLLATTIQKDIIPRYNPRSFQFIKEILSLLIASLSKDFSYRNIGDTLGIGSVTTTKKYISYLTDTYLLGELIRFAPSIRTQLSYNKKIYTIDNGYLLPFFHISENKGPLLENIVYQHIMRTYDIYFYHREIQSNKECDFVIQKRDNNRICIQVCYYLNHDNQKRELEGIHCAMKKFQTSQGYILTYNQEYEINGIKVLPVWKYLLGLH